MAALATFSFLWLYLANSQVSDYRTIGPLVVVIVVVVCLFVFGFVFTCAYFSREDYQYRTLLSAFAHTCSETNP